MKLRGGVLIKLDCHNWSRNKKKRLDFVNKLIINLPPFSKPNYVGANLEIRKSERETLEAKREFVR